MRVIPASMKPALPRILLALLTVAATGLVSGCASMTAFLQVTADELQRQQDAMAYQAYVRDYYGPRPSSDTSAPGIR